jgi:hypothetical protein
MALEETNSEKHDVILSLRLRSTEWERVALFLGLLAVRVMLFCFKHSSTE